MSETTVSLSVADAYDRWAGFYDVYENPTVFAAGHAVAALAAEIRDKAVLEFGCGTGRNLAALKAAGAARLVGLDLSPGMLEQARLRDPALELMHQDMGASVPLPDGAFDLVLFSLTLEHVADMVAPLQEARRLLRPGGLIAVIEIHPFLSLGGVAAHFEDGDEVVHMPTVTHTFAAYINAAASAGLTIVSCREWLAGDFGPDTPARVLKRGPDSPRIVQFGLKPSS